MRVILCDSHYISLYLIILLLLKHISTFIEIFNSDNIVKNTPMYNNTCPNWNPIQFENKSPSKIQIIATIVTAVLILPNWPLHSQILVQFEVNVNL